MSDMFYVSRAYRDEALVTYLYDDIGPSDRAAFESHLAGCSVYAHSELASLAAVREQLAQWAPPDLQVAGGRWQAAGPAQPETRRWWKDVPAWAQLAAALLLLGVAAGTANLNIHYDQSGLTVRTGWMRPPAAGAQATPWRADFTRLEDSLRGELRSSSVQTSLAGMTIRPRPFHRARPPRQVMRRSCGRSERSSRRARRRSRSSSALRVAQVPRDVQAQRLADLTRIDHNFGLIQNNTGFEMARQRELVNSLAVRVSQTLVTRRRRKKAKAKKAKSEKAKSEKAKSEKAKGLLGIRYEDHCTGDLTWTRTHHHDTLVCRKRR